jgi:hypothetical protein
MPIIPPYQRWKEENWVFPAIQGKVKETLFQKQNKI